MEYLGYIYLNKILWSFSDNCLKLYKQGNIGKIIQQANSRKVITLIALPFEPLS